MQLVTRVRKLTQETLLALRLQWNGHKIRHGTTLAYWKRSTQTICTSLLRICHTLQVNPNTHESRTTLRFQVNYSTPATNRLFSHSSSMLFRPAKPEFYCHTKRVFPRKLLPAVLHNTTPHSTAQHSPLSVTHIIYPWRSVYDWQRQARQNVEFLLYRIGHLKIWLVSYGKHNRHSAVRLTTGP